MCRELGIFSIIEKINGDGTHKSGTRKNGDGAHKSDNRTRNLTSAVWIQRVHKRLKFEIYCKIAT
jgi:hypothetical protein